MPEEQRERHEQGEPELPEVGLRVMLRSDIDTLVIGGEPQVCDWVMAQAGDVGTVVRADEELILVQLDEHPAEEGWTGLLWWEPGQLFNEFWEVVVEVNIEPPGRLRFGITLRIAVEVEIEDLRELGPQTAFAQAAAHVIAEEGLDRDHVAEWAVERRAES